MLSSTSKFLDRLFKVQQKGSTVPTEILAGLTTFVAMAYIIFVNPSILEASGKWGRFHKAMENEH